MYSAEINKHLNEQKCKRMGMKMEMQEEDVMDEDEPPAEDAKSIDEDGDVEMAEQKSVFCH